MNGFNLMTTSDIDQVGSTATGTGLTIQLDVTLS